MASATRTPAPATRRVGRCRTSRHIQTRRRLDSLRLTWLTLVRLFGVARAVVRRVGYPQLAGRKGTHRCCRRGRMHGLRGGVVTVRESAWRGAVSHHSAQRVRNDPLAAA